jgi:anti-sigma-K factor RskA
MKDADRTIERLLAALRDAEPSAGIGHRILQAMEAREAEVSAPLWRRPTALAASLATALAITAVLIIAMALHQHRTAPADTRSHAPAMHLDGRPNGAIWFLQCRKRRRPASLPRLCL